MIQCGEVPCLAAINAQNNPSATHVCSGDNSPTDRPDSDHDSLARSQVSTQTKQGE